jgi:hypothetical protein
MYRILLATTGDRPHLMFPCLDSLKKYAPEIPVVLIGQEVPDEVRGQILEWKRSTNHHLDVVWQDKRSGAHCAKVAAMQAFPDTAAWVSIDDDMELVKETDYLTPLEKCQESGVGLVSCNWAQTEKMLPKKIAKMTKEYKSQKIVYTGGGLVYGKAVADILTTLPLLPYVTDNALWSAVVYTSGYLNMRYMGSLAIHRILSPGGRKAYLKTVNSVFPVPEYLTMRPCVDQYYDCPTSNCYIPDSGDLTELAHNKHKENRSSLLALDA